MRTSSRSSGRASAWALVSLAALGAALLWFALGDGSGEDVDPRSPGLSESASPAENGRATAKATTSAPDVQREATGGALRDASAVERDPELLAEADAEFATGIFGRVTDPAGAPISGALCEVVETGTTERAGAARTDAQGQFAVRGLSAEDPPELTLSISHPAYAPTIVDGIETAPGIVIPIGILVLYAPAALSGLCIDESTGAPVASALVTAVLSFEGTHVVLEGSRTRSDAEGRFRSQGLPAGLLRIHARAPGHATRLLEEIAIVAGEAREHYRVRLRAVPPLEGRVEDAEGRPIAGVDVGYRPKNSTVPALEREIARSDAEGRFRFLSPDPERGYALWIEDPRFLPVSHQAVSFEASEIRLRVAGGPRLLVQLEGARDGEPSFVLESAVGPEQAPDPRFFRSVVPHLSRFVATRDGYESGALDPKHWYRVSVRCGDLLSAQSAPLKLDPQASAPQLVRLKLDAGAKFRLRVLDPLGAPIPAAFVRLERGDAAHALRTDADGRAACGAFGGGDFRVNIDKQGYAPFEENVHVPPEGASEDYILHRGGRLFGRVTIGGAAPSKPLQVWLRDAGALFQRSTETGADGSYAFDGLPLDESYELYPLQGKRPNAFCAQRFAHPIEDDDRFAFDESYEFVVELEAAVPEKSFDIDLPRVQVAHVRGVVRDEKGPRKALAVVALLFDTGAEEAALSDAEGRFDLEIAGAGDLDLEVRASRGEDVLWMDRLELIEGQDLQVEIRLRTASLIALVLDAAGAPVPGARVLAKLGTAIGSSENAPIGGTRRADADHAGVARFETLVEGSYDFEASAPGHALGIVRHHEVLSGAENARVEIRLEDAAIAELRILDDSGQPLLQTLNVEIYDAGGTIVPFRDGTARGQIRGGQLRLDHLTAGNYRFVLVRTATRLERYASLEGGETPQVIEWRLEIGGAGGDAPSRHESDEGKDGR